MARHLLKAANLPEQSKSGVFHSCTMLHIWRPWQTGDPSTSAKDIGSLAYMSFPVRLSGRHSSESFRPL